MAYPPENSASVAQSSNSIAASSGVGYTPKQQNILTALNQLLSVMLTRDDIINQEGIFRVSSDQNELNKNNANIVNGKTINYKDLTPVASSDLVKQLLRELRNTGLPLINNESMNESTDFTLESFNSDPQIQNIIHKLFQLLRKIADHSSTNENKMDAQNLGVFVAPNLFQELNYQSNPFEALSINSANIRKVASLINASAYIVPQEIPQPTVTTGSSHEFILNQLSPNINQVLRNNAVSLNKIVIASNIEEIRPRSFFSRHLSKLLMTPLVGLFAAGLTVTLLIVFPPAGLVLTTAILVGAGIAAGVVGAGFGFGAGAAVDSARSDTYQREQLEAAGYSRFDSEQILNAGLPIVERQNPEIIQPDQAPSPENQVDGSPPSP